MAGEISKEYDSTISAGHVISQALSEPSRTGGDRGLYCESRTGSAEKTVYRLPWMQVILFRSPTDRGSVLRDPDPDPFKQTVNGKVTYTKLAEPKSYSADTTLNIKLDKIRGADGVDR